MKMRLPFAVLRGLSTKDICGSSRPGNDYHRFGTYSGGRSKLWVQHHHPGLQNYNSAYTYQTLKQLHSPINYLYDSYKYFFPYGAGIA
jgi:hypothetical protein